MKKLIFIVSCMLLACSFLFALDFYTQSKMPDPTLQDWMQLSLDYIRIEFDPIKVPIYISVFSEFNLYAMEYVLHIQPKDFAIYIRIEDLDWHWTNEGRGNIIYVIAHTELMKIKNISCEKTLKIDWYALAEYQVQIVVSSIFR